MIVPTVDGDLMLKNHTTDQQKKIIETKERCIIITDDNGQELQQEMTFEQLILDDSQRRTSSVQKIAKLGLSDRANRLSGAYQRIEEQDKDQEMEMEFEFDYNEKALESADK